MSLSLRGVMKPGAACVGPMCPGCSSGNCMSAGGKVMGVHEDMGDYGGKKGVSPAGDSVRRMKAGTYKQFETVDPKQSHERVLKEMKMLPKPKLYAGGGAVKDSSPPEIDQEKAKQFEKGFNSPSPSFGEAMSNIKTGLGLAEGGEVMDADGDMDGDDGGDSAMLDSCAGELIDALDRKDKGQILEALKAIVLSVR